MGSAAIPIISHFENEMYIVKKHNWQNIVHMVQRLLGPNAHFNILYSLLTTPISTGRRACAGESLAKMELFLLFVGLLQAFTFYPPPGVSCKDLNLKPGVGFVLMPLPYMTCAKLNY